MRAANTMAMLPNDKHPGTGCSCADCLRAYPEQPTSKELITPDFLRKRGAALIRDWESTDAVLLAAADEIERLQREVERLDGDCVLLQCERDMLKQQRADWKAVADSRPVRASAEPPAVLSHLKNFVAATEFNGELWVRAADHTRELAKVRAAQPPSDAVLCRPCEHCSRHVPIDWPACGHCGEYTRKVPEPAKQPTTCGYCSYEEADGELIEQCAKCKAIDEASVTKSDAEGEVK